MNPNPLLDRSLGELARSLPGATGIFFAHELDFCCGGKQLLRDALAARQLDPAPLLKALEGLIQHPLPAEHDWAQAPRTALIEHILERYHAAHRQQLPELVRLSRRVESVHADRPECPHGLADHLEGMAHELESHMQKEEQILFPLLAQGIPAAGLPPVNVMRHEHDQHGLALERMVALAHQLDMPRGACNTWRALITGLRSLRADLMEHIHLENNLLFE